MRQCACLQYTRAADLAFVFLSKNFRNVIAPADSPPTACGVVGVARAAGPRWGASVWVGSCWSGQSRIPALKLTARGRLGWLV